MTEQSTSLTGKATALTLACMLLNLGLFVVLMVIAPLVAGLMVGLAIPRRWWAVCVGLVGAMLAYTLLFLWVSLTAGTINIYGIVMAVLIMSSIGGIGGLLGEQIVHLSQRYLIRYRQ